MESHNRAHTTHSPVASRRLIVNADDFGRSASINEAVIKAHRDGILTTASLMVNGEAADEAVQLARENPKLGVGLHLTLVCGRSALKPTEVPGLVNNHYRFSDNPAAAGMRYYFRKSLRSQLRQEINAQVQKFKLTGLQMDHLNGHLHLHLHPTVFSIIRHHAEDWGIKRVRLTRDPFWLSMRLDPGRILYRIFHASAFKFLSNQASQSVSRLGLRHTHRVFGMLQDSNVNEAYLSKLLRRLPRGDSELYSHPSMHEFKHEFDALVSPVVRSLVAEQGIQLIRYQDL